VVDVSVGGQEAAPVAVRAGVVLGDAVDVEEEAVSFRVARFGRDDC